MAHNSGKSKYDPWNEIFKKEIRDNGLNHSEVARKYSEQCNSPFNGIRIHLRNMAKKDDEFKSNFYSTEHKALKEECDAVGIPKDNVNHYWYKGENFSIHVKNQGVTFEQMIDKLTGDMMDYKVDYPKIKRTKIKDGHLLVIDIADLHINKYAQSHLSGFDYNAKIAVQRALDGTQGIINKASGFPIDRILFVVGNDVLHTDNITKGTTKGTLQDTEFHWFDAFQIAKKCYIRCIEMCMQIADVDIVHCPSNHDFMTGCLLASTLEAWFRNSKNVTFDSSPKYRKYYQYHSNMIELEHGDKGKSNNIPLTMANEEPKMWAETKFRYSYLHHIHHLDQTKYKSSKDYQQINVTYVRSPSSPDLWHYDNQYLNLIAIEGFVHSKNHGRVSHLTHYF